MAVLGVLLSRKTAPFEETAVPRRTTTRLTALAAAGATVLALAGCTSQGGQQISAPAAVQDPTTPAVVDEPTAEPASPSAPGSPSPTTAPSPAKPAFSYDVAAVQTRLTAQKYYAGAIDGRRGRSLRSAVMAFQKVNGLGIDGTVGPKTLAAISAPRAPVLKGSSPANRVEVDLSKQVAYVVKGGAIARILPVSSGNGRRYEQKDGSEARALTPVGYYTVQRRIVGERKADLGSLYDPQYFYRGWAIHGSNSVPAGPASHGCVRVTRADAKYLLDAISVGTAVYLYGGTHTFTAGSSAPGTDAPTGDTAADATEPTTAPSPAPVRTETTSPRPVSSPSPTAAPRTQPSATTAPSARPTASPTAR